MTSEDYFNWANEYRQEAEAVEHRIQQTKTKRKAKLGNIERMKLEKDLSMLFEQKMECLCIAKGIEERAKAIKEKEG
jgi:hypothetical protein